MINASRAILLMAVSVALAAARTANTPMPGEVNYVEGRVALDGQNLSAASVGSALLEPNQVLTTSQGRAELLLTPGVFLRIGDNSEVRMVSPDLTNTQVELSRGSAMLEVTELFKENNLCVLVGGANTRIDKVGLYDFNAGQPGVRVLDGEATVFQGDQHINLKKGHIVMLAAGAPFKAQSFNKDAVQSDPLYRWSSLRSEYEAQANLETAQTVVVNGVDGMDPAGIGIHSGISTHSCPEMAFCTAPSAGDSTRPDSPGELRIRSFITALWSGRYMGGRRPLVRPG